MEKEINMQELTEFFKINEEKIYKFAYGYVKNQDIALDLVHESIVKAIQKKNSIREKKYFKTWFYRILINECLGYLKKRNKILFFEEIKDKENIGTLEENSDNNIDLYDAIDKLPEKLKTIIMLRFFEDMTLDEISQIMKTNLSTVKSRLHKALEILKIDMKGEKL